MKKAARRGIDLSGEPAHHTASRPGGLLPYEANGGKIATAANFLKNSPRTFS